MLRRIVPILLASASLVACSGSSGALEHGSGASRSGDSWSSGLPRGEPTIVTMENLSYAPSRVLGLVSANHPAAQTQEAAIRRSGIKRVPVDRMDRLLEVLEDDGFVASAAPLAEFTQADARIVLRRLTVSIGEQRRAFTLPRGPTKEAADRFNKQAIAVQAMFNEIVDFRQEVGFRDPDYFYAVARALFDPNMHRREDAGKDGKPSKDGKQ